MLGCHALDGREELEEPRRRLEALLVIPALPAHRAELGERDAHEARVDALRRPLNVWPVLRELPPLELLGLHLGLVVHSRRKDSAVCVGGGETNETWQCGKWGSVAMAGV